MEKQYDIIIIGAGSCGCGIALESASRGYKTLVLEQNDFCEGTSSRSTKLLHGGVRYLEAAVKKLSLAQYKLVKEALKERFVAIQNAPHISQAITLVTPIYRWWELPYMFIGLSLYDLIAGKKGLGRSKIVSRKELIKTHPHVKKEGLVGGVEYYDGSFNDSRMGISLLKTAQSYGCELKNYHKVEKFLYENDKVCGVEVYDKLKDEKLIFKAKSIINATGAFSDGVRKLDDKNAQEKLDLSSGIHIVLDKKYLPSNKGLMIPKTKDGRVLFILPWMGKCLVGTTDESCKVSEHPKVKDEEIEYILEHLKIYFDLEIDKSEILSSWSGIRPLVAAKSKDTASLVRDHEIFSSNSGLISIIGGKWTTYRKMAEEAVQYAIKKDGLEKSECKTERLKLIGAQGKKPKLNIDGKLKEYLLYMYGNQASEILGYDEKINYLHPNYALSKAELFYSIENEYVKKPLDFLVRRTSLALIDKQAAKECLKEVNDLMAQKLAWDEKTKKAMFDEAENILQNDL